MDLNEDFPSINQSSFYECSQEIPDFLPHSYLAEPIHIPSLALIPIPGPYTFSPTQNYQIQHSPEPYLFTVPPYQTLHISPVDSISVSQPSQEQPSNDVPTTCTKQVSSRTRWNDGEVKVLINVYKDQYVKKEKGKSLDLMWDKVAKRLNSETKEIDVYVGEKTGKNCRDKINNLSKKYKTVKDKLRATGGGSEEIKGFPEFQDLDEIWGTKDFVNPKYVLESSDDLVLEESETIASATTSSGTPSPYYTESQTESLLSISDNEGMPLVSAVPCYSRKKRSQEQDTELTGAAKKPAQPKDEEDSRVYMMDKQIN